jgi:hypothetical protein
MNCGKFPPIFDVKFDKNPLLRTLDRVKWAGKLERKKRYSGIRVWSTDSPKAAHQPIRLLFDNRCTSAIPF